VSDVAAPAWFTRAIADEPEVDRTVVDGAEVATLAWGGRDQPTLVLVHGGAAHARWWSPLAPLLAERSRVVALDLTGHGDSDRREVYRVEQWADEIVAAAEAVGGSGRPIVAGHSMGGFVTIATAALHGRSLDGAIVIDAPVRRLDPESAEAVGGRMFRSPKTYPDLATGIEHFHLVPPQPCENPWMLEHVARTSLTETAGGWTWKFDPGVFVRRAGPTRTAEFAPLLARAACRVAVVNGADSAIVDEDVRAYMAELLAGSPAAVAGVPFIEVPEARHHLMLDQPLAVVTALRAILAAWHPVGQQPPVPPIDPDDPVRPSS
jgi:pimeloyl-ACP methyl ester carboxylesterase